MSHPRVLLVEDNPADVFLLRRALRSVAPDLDLEVLEDGLSALRYLSSLPAGRDAMLREDVPSLVVLDLNLPGVNGDEILRTLRSGSLARLPVVVLTTSDEEDDRQRSLAAGADLFLTKPGRYPRLVEMVRGWINLFIEPVDNKAKSA